MLYRRTQEAHSRSPLFTFVRFRRFRACLHARKPSLVGFFLAINREQLVTLDGVSLDPNMRSESCPCQPAPARVTSGHYSRIDNFVRSLVLYITILYCYMSED